MSLPSAYAKGTTVPAERSKAELDGLLSKHGAGQRAILHDEQEGFAAVVFVLRGRKYKIELPMPVPTPPKAGAEPRGWLGWDEHRRSRWARTQWEQACRERWRGLVLLVKAKLEIVRLGVSTFEREFLADLMLPDGHTAHQTIGAYMERLIADGYSQPLALPSRSEGP